MRDEAKKSVKDHKDYVAINKKILEVFEDYMNKHGKAKVAKEIVDYAEEIKQNRAAKKKK